MSLCFSRHLRGGIPSPRIAHLAGAIPPALSPLDAFAAQGRFLAKQLDESQRGERRMSRLPPSSVARSLSRPRPGYYRSTQSDSRTETLTRRPTQKGLPEVEEPKYRPVSEHPRFSSISQATSVADSQDGDTTPRTTMISENPSELGIPRSESPYEDASLADEEGDSVGVALSDRQSSTDSTTRLHIPRTLAPPASPHSRPSSSARAAHQESSDDDNSSSNGGSTFSKPRKLSSGSTVSIPYSPLSTFPARPHPRSPSMSSETSGVSYLGRPSFNFSRPLSRSSTNLSVSGVEASLPPPTTQLHQQPSDMNRPTKPSPILVPLATAEAAQTQPAEGEPSSAVSSYTYASYALPRGRELARDSVIFAGLQTPDFEWKGPIFDKTPPRHSDDIPRSAHTPPPTSQRTSNACVPQARPGSYSAHPERAPRSSAESTQPLSNDKEETASSADSASTLRPKTATTQVPSNNLSDDDHVAKAIELHEKGSLNESTYHLRIAAKQNNPTGMLLYALACRHGWGMRPNQQEGVKWLRKAVDLVGLEMLENPDAPGASKAKEIQKAYRAQFALSIYEMGVSYLNGWGIEQNKALALRCFEIAGQWGDADAMAEAGFCYAEGVGCKKDMHKAARFYRNAESNGMSIVGNSWIYKEKYMEKEKENKSRSRGRTHDNKNNNDTRSKSRTRSIFQRKKSGAE
ncbi:hypothetical protein N7468_004292 [Penicillium chermesinum]|uniref:Cell cycle inhibitor Nif1 n=1 Tax=Penicillium chermesinum TaxID=63820 RepID=A0A9W9P860_9EURO|nr:uncharacterized protein N7468_004292 [Penicillium chermesinum]KAJ5239673.1 hypothetical protein N7468_004292 [Penicillium chermesinum]